MLNTHSYNAACKTEQNLQIYILMWKSKLKLLVDYSMSDRKVKILMEIEA